MGVLYLAPARRGVGVTAVAAGLAALWRRAGQRVAAVKPVALAGDADGAFLARVAGNAAIPSRAVPGEVATADIEALASSSDVVVVEGLPLADAGSAALAKRLDATVVGVVTDAPDGMLWRSTFGEAYVGCIVNRLPRFAIGGTAGDVLAIVPEDRLLVAPAVGQVVAHIGGTYFTGPYDDEALIEHFVIGGLITEWGGNYFGRLSNQAVLVRGGRLDIQLAALNFDINCMVLTACNTPPQYAYLRAEEQGIPLVTVPTNTTETAEALESVQSRSTMHHDVKAERVAALLADTVRWDALNAAASVS